jgi:hypothetical protein
MYRRRMTDAAPYLEERCTLHVSGWEIPAALTLPAVQGVTLPATVQSATLLVPGSLFSDVNGDYPTWNSFPHVYAHLARQLSALGHAVYRFAKLGPGTGSVVVDAARAAATRTWDGRVVIAAAALDAMRAELGARGIAARRIVAAGHSEGSVVVSRLALSDAGATLDGVVLLAGPSVGILEIMREQMPQSVPAEELDDARRQLDEVIGYVRRGDPIPAAFAETAPMGVRHLATIPEDGRRYMRQVDATDPLQLADRMPQPVLVVQGGSDTSVPAHHGLALRDRLAARTGGAGRTQYLFVPEVTHMFKVVPPEVAGPDAFGYPGETDPGVTGGIDRWIRALPG